MHRVDAVGNSPGVRRELIEGIRSLPGWHKGVRKKKTETGQNIIGGSRKACRETNYEGAIKLQSDNGPRSSLGIGPGLDDVVGSRQEFARRFAKGIRKLAGSTLGDHLKKTG
ncbi:hypothetical protein B296_00016290 [Ensete ventricosum]|uniref:Uncharacterized protein n=1 Tax=Ensete ventricosum TaxID=4639 RepID=A0A426XBP0_ENSVE|nr:hypothetical protein B296_00016290 [Ensete ventricosum]